MASQEQSSLDLPQNGGAQQKSTAGPGGRYVEAESHFERALQLDRNHLESLKYLGMCLFQLGKHAKAAERFRQVLAVEPDNEEVLLTIGTACLSLGHYDEAERHQRKAAAVNPKNARAFLGLGQSLYRKGLYGEAVNVLRRGDELDKQNPDILFMLGEAYNKLDQIDLAISCFEAILELQQENPKVFYNLGILYDKKSMPDKASLMYRRAKELSSPRTLGKITSSISSSGDSELFFSRSLTVVGQPEPRGKEKALNRKRFQKFKKTQLNRKPHRVIEETEQPEKIGTMDLTKASLKINEAIKLIKENKR